MLQSRNKQEMVFGNCDSGHIFMFARTDTFAVSDRRRGSALPLSRGSRDHEGPPSRFRRTMVNAAASSLSISDTCRHMHFRFVGHKNGRKDWEQPEQMNRLQEFSVLGQIADGSQGCSPTWQRADFFRLESRVPSVECIG
jgi:hypothetical protein